jgi:hypothetical protein
VHRTIAARFAFGIILLANGIVAGADAALAQTPITTDVFNSNSNTSANDPVRCFDRALRNTRDAVQAYQIVDAKTWAQELDCRGGSGAAPELDPCWDLVMKARPLVEQAAGMYGSARRTPEPNSGQLVRQGNARNAQAAALVKQAGQCFAPVFAAWERAGGRYVTVGTVDTFNSNSLGSAASGPPSANSNCKTIIDRMYSLHEQMKTNRDPGVAQTLQQQIKALEPQFNACIQEGEQTARCPIVMPPLDRGQSSQQCPPASATCAPGADRFLSGVQDGTRLCARSFENLVGAVLALVQGDFVRSLELLGIEHSDVATQFLTAIANDLTAPLATEPLTPYANGYRISRRICTYATIWRPRARNPAVGPQSPSNSAPVLQARSWPRGLESGGANVWIGKYLVDPCTGQRFPIMGRSRVPSSYATSTVANKGESLSYHEARFTQGEIGLQAPAGANVPGADFITAARSPTTGLMEIIVTDVKTSMKGDFPIPKTTIPGSWRTEVLDAIGRLQLGDAELETEIVDAVMNNRVRLRQLNVDLGSATQDIARQSVNISGW